MTQSAAVPIGKSATPRYTTAEIRNVAMVGHAHAGKTTLVEALLQKAGAINTAGSVERGTTVSDFEPEEKAHQHSLASAVVHADFRGRHINLIDTPGMPDFMGQALPVLSAVETVAVVVNAHAGIELLTRRMMERAEERKLCRVIVVSKIDDGADLAGLVEQIQKAFGPQCLPINLPAQGGKAVADVFDHASGESDFSSVAEAHRRIVEQVVEVDEQLMAKYLEQGESVKPEQLHDPFEKALREGHLVPILFTSARTGAGVAELLEFLANLAPSPLEGNPRPFEHGEPPQVAPLSYDADPAKNVIAHVFKVTTDPFVGRLGIFRIYQGTVRKESQLYIGDAKRPFKVGHLFKLQGKDHVEIDAGIPGDIAAVAKVEEIHYGQVLHDSAAHGHVHLAPMNFPKPMAGLAISTRSRGDEAKLGRALAALTAEDPCFVVEHTTEGQHETVIRGLGEMHLRVMLEKMHNRYNVEVDTKPPRIAYRETIAGKAEGHYRHKKQTGGAGQFGEVFLRVEPLARGAGFEFSNDVFGGAIPTQFIPAVEKGVRQVLAEGAVAGYPLQDVRVSVYDGKHHPVDSKEIAFVIAGRNAFKDAVTKARPAVLEPIVNLEVVVPEQNMGDIAGDLSARRGRILGTDAAPGGRLQITAQAPLSELQQYSSHLKSVTAGQGSYTMELDHYEPVPPHVQQQLTAAYKPRAEEE